MSGAMDLPDAEEELAALSQALNVLPLRIGIYVPDDLLEDWFAPGTGMNPVSSEALDAAETFARRHDCEFRHYPEHKKTIMWKWVPAL
jgi:hypothetical protein